MSEGDFASCCMLVIMVVFYCSPMLKRMDYLEKHIDKIEKRLDLIEKALYVVPIDGGDNNVE